MIFGKINWGIDLRERTQQNHRFSNGILNLHATRIHNFNFDEKSFFYNDKTRVLSCVIGYMSNLEEIRSKFSIKDESDVEIIEKLYSFKKLKFISELDGVFLIFVFDENIKKGYIFQSEYGFNLALYYTRTDNEFIFSTSLRQILKYTNKKRELNFPAVCDFLRYQFFISSKQTLIKNINKLTIRKYLIINFATGSLQIKSLRRDKKIILISKTKQDLLKSIGNNLSNLFSQLKTKNTIQSLTGGYDSNLILFFIRKLTNGPINVVTMDGGWHNEYNEVPRVKSILKNYSNIKHITGIIKQENINSYPDLVWKYEGCIFEPALFFYYEVAKLLSKENCRFIFLGAPANEILLLPSDRESLFRTVKTSSLRENIFMRNIYRIITGRSKTKLDSETKIRRNLVRIFRHFPHSIYSLLPFTMRTYCLKSIDHIVKYHGIPLNSFSIQGIFPFVSKNIATMSMALRNLNENRDFYLKKIKEEMPPEITHHLKGSMQLANTAGLFDANKNLLLKVFKTEFVNKILTKRQIDKILQNPKDYTSLIFQLVYIHLFNELFVSGKFDSRFNTLNVDTALSNFFN